MKRFGLFLLGVLSGLTITAVLVKHPDEDPEIEIEKDQEDLD